MKKGLISIVLSLGLLSGVAIAKGHGGSKHDGYNNSLNNSVSQVNVLTQEQIDGLVFMYEEEKVARDAYIVLGDIWDAKVFHNIQRAEIKHMAAIERLLVKYGIEVPMLSDEVGVFENIQLQEEYDKLAESGEQSLKEALEVGVAIEVMDIQDLKDRMIDAPDDILRVYERLLRGSENHLRAFNRQLSRI